VQKEGGSGNCLTSLKIVHYHHPWFDTGKDETKKRGRGETRQEKGDSRKRLFFSSCLSDSHSLSIGPRKRELEGSTG